MNEESIFAAALKLQDPSQRQAYLDEACQDNPQLRSQVEELLKASGDAGSFLDHPPAGLMPTVQVDAGEHETLKSGPAGSELPFLEPCDKPDRIGKLLGKVGEYEIMEVVGQGGMGAVLRAYDTKLSRVVAVKVLAPELAANATAVKRFLREAQSAAAVHHDHVVTIHAIDDTHRPPFIVMQFIEGQTLQQKIDREGALDLKQILRIGSQMGAGLAAAHKHGLIHRDVKPANILLENGVERVKISDFGLARAADDLEMTKAGQIAGTPQYMSPEQAQGEPIDPRSDLFSLGSVLYAMCTGRPAFRAETAMAVMRRVCEDTPRPIREVNAEIPDWLAEIIEKLLAKDRDARFQTAQEVADLLGQHLAHLQQPHLPRPPRLGKPVSSAGRRRTSVAAVAAVILLACLALGVSEATGVTRLAGTIVRVFTGEGTLLIKVDDPNVSLSIDGEELIISGAGVKEIRLKPGQYRLHASKDGRTLRSESVNVVRGGKAAFEVSMEQPPAQIASEKLRQQFRSIVQAARDGLTDEEQKSLAQQLRLLPGPAYRRALEILAAFPEDSHRRLLAEGYLKWPYDSLDATRQAALGEIFALLFDQLQKTGVDFGKLVNAEKFRDLLVESDVGYAVVNLSESGPQLVSFYALTQNNPLPISLPIVFSDLKTTEMKALQDPQFEQLRALRNKPYSPLPGLSDSPAVAEEPSSALSGEWVPLFNGKDLTGWKTHPDYPGDWRVENGLLVGRGTGISYLFSDRNDFGDFHLRAEIRIEGKVDSGILFRSGREIHHEKFPAAYEANITTGLSYRTSPLNMTIAASPGGIILAPYQTDTAPSGAWFVHEVIAEGNHLIVKLDGRTAAEFTDDKSTHQRGYLALQVYGIYAPETTVSFRKIEIRQPQPDSADGWIGLFNGNDLTGWRAVGGKPATWSVENGVLRGAGAASYLVSDHSFADFHLKAEMRVSPGGEWGLLFRTDPAGLGEKELPPGLAVQCTYKGQTNDVDGHMRMEVQFLRDAVPLAINTVNVKPNDWFPIELIARGGKVEIKISGGGLAASGLGTKLPAGPIILQLPNPDCALEFRQIEIKPLPDAT